MDVEIIKKINDLALDLMRQGLASDRADAIKQAEKHFKQDSSDNYQSMLKTMGGHEEEVQVQSDTKADIPLSKDEIKEILEKNTNYLVKTIKEFQEKMKTMEEEMKILKNKVAIQSASKIISRPTVPPPVEHQQPQQQQARGMPQQPIGNHPRSGNNKSDDVSIEKIFYMGK